MANDSFAATLACRRELPSAREKMARNFAACVHIWRETERGPFPGYFFTAYPYPSLSVRCWGEKNTVPAAAAALHGGRVALPLQHRGARHPTLRGSLAWRGGSASGVAFLRIAATGRWCRGHTILYAGTCICTSPNRKVFSVADCRGLCTDHYLWLLLLKDKCISIESIRKIYDIQNAFFDELLVEII